jgi:alpha-L-rhamnosidase
MLDTPSFLWSPEADHRAPDTHLAFRATFTLASDTTVDISLLGATWFAAWVDEAFLGEGPARFTLTHPEYQTHRVTLKAGKHVLAVQVHHAGMPTRLMNCPTPFLYAVARTPESDIPLIWKCQRLTGYQRTRRRINGQLGWTEWCDTRGIPAWKTLAFDDTEWHAPVPIDAGLGPLQPLSIGLPRANHIPLKPVAQGTLVEMFGYEPDNPQARFFLRDLHPAALPPQGVWRRYDLGRIRLARPRIVLDVPPGSVIEMAQSEALTTGRVVPWITLSDSDSCNMDHFIAHGGRQEFTPLHPKGGRWLEVHVLAPPKSVTFAEEGVIERTYFGEMVGSLSTGDKRLDHIWKVGVETLRACSEDAIIDNPTRERGQWAGDVVSVGLDVGGVAFSDLRVFKRGLVQCAENARADGIVSGMCPGQNMFLSTYAAQWTSACVRYVERTGDKELLTQLFPAAERNVAAFEARRTDNGVDNGLAWAFVDWGYVPNPGPSDMALNLHYLEGVQNMARWSELLGKTDGAARYQAIARSVRQTIQRYFAATPSWEARGFHRTALALRLGFFSGTEEREAIAALKAHILRCFPNDEDAPRLSSPSAANPRLITPYFAHFAFPALIARDEMAFVLEQYRKCWGWALTIEDGTWLEVFDPRWSHCHQWSGCPTWQMSQTLLGLRPRFDLGVNHFEFSLHPGGLSEIKGVLPAQGGRLAVTWKRTRTGLDYSLQTDVPVTIHDGQQQFQIPKTWKRSLPLLL